MPNNRPEHSSSKVVEFPKNYEQRIQTAWADFAKGNRVKALKEFLSLIDGGCDQAYVFVGGFYDRGCEGVERDYEKARFYYERAIETCGSVEAYLGLARLYYFGLGVNLDYCKAFSYYEKVAKEAEQNGVAYLMLGQMYQHGQCAKKDLQKAKDCYQRAWQKGYLLGLTYLGKLEQEMGHPIKGWLHRLKAGFLGYKIARKDPHDPRFRSS